MTISTQSSREAKVVEDVQADHAWSLVEEFSTLVRESGSDDERRAVAAITSRLDAWGVPYTCYAPELLISLPRAASLTVAGVAYRSKTPSMAGSTPPEGVTAPLVHEAGAYAASVSDIFSASSGSEDVAGKLVVTEGFPMPGKIVDLESRGAVGVIVIAPGEWIHEGICTSVWGSPDLTTLGQKPTIPVISISRSDGERVVDAVAGGASDATIVAEHDDGWRPIPVVVAEIRGSVEPERFVLVHGHIDSWHVGVGDNATGDATLLELARVLAKNQDLLARSVRIAWWSGHSHGRYAGSTWFADAFALDLERNCICHVNCDSPGCRDASVYEDVYWMAEVEKFAKDAILDFTGLSAQGGPPIRAGDISFSNLGVSTFFMLTSTMPSELRQEKGYYAVGGCGGNIEWHTEADILEIADRDNLLRDIRLYSGAVFRAANAPVHPLDFRETVAQIETLLRGVGERVDGLVDLAGTDERVEALNAALDELYRAAAAAPTIESARPFNDALLRIGRSLVTVLYSKIGPYRQDPALHVPLMPELTEAANAIGSVPDGVLRTEFLRARNRLDNALENATEHALRAVRDAK